MPILASIQTYFKESAIELRKVSWPSRQETIQSSITVVAVSVGVAIFFSIIDYLLTRGLSVLLSR